ncbi:MAG: hypothetical protein LQ339_004201 [Xanthoria mediterranea]|nr:MAG: hypothetical protein LQ339_004201 [Xanthoria mediterranea]
MMRLSYPLVGAQVEQLPGPDNQDLELADTDPQLGLKETAYHTCLHYRVCAHNFSSSLIIAGVKRASDGQASAAKRARLSNQEQDMIPKDRLEANGKDDLVAHILKLQAQILSTSQASPSPPATPGLSEEETHGKASKARDMMEKGIKSQMKVSLPH